MVQGRFVRGVTLHKNQSAEGKAVLLYLPITVCLIFILLYNYIFTQVYKCIFE